MELAVAVSTFGVLVSAFAVWVGYQVAQMQKTLAQRQLIIPLWDHMAGLNDIDPANPDAAHVLRAVNTLELVALCCEGGMVDERVIKRTFREPFIQLYNAIEGCPELEDLGRSGAELIHENPAAMAFYETLRREHMDRDKLARL